jgi:hypothetical protein
MSSFTRTTRIPKWLRFLHGRAISISDLICIYGFGITISLCLMIFGHFWIMWIPWFKQVLLFLIIFSITSGIPASLMPEVKEYYYLNTWLKYLMPLLHIIEPLGLWWIFNNGFFSYAFITTYTIGLTYLLILHWEKKTHSIISLLSLCVGIFIVFFILKFSNILFLIILFYMIRMLWCYSAKYGTVY